MTAIKNEVLNSSDSRKKIWIVLPVYNEAARLQGLIDRWLIQISLLKQSGYDCAFVLVDDGSTDGSDKILAENKTKISSFEIITHQKNAGLGATLKDGLEYARKNAFHEDFLVTMDSDGTHPPELIFSMIKTIDRYKAGVIIASRFRKGSKVVGLSVYRRFLSFAAAIVLKILIPVSGVRDYTCGFRLIRFSALQKLIEENSSQILIRTGFDATLELLVNLSVCNAKIREVPFLLDYSPKSGHSHMNIWRTATGILSLALSSFLRK
ncbi:MAG: glycosyltransferase family 2 protein [Candidatus Riflebacteria bacterium]|nr:glycosyltransferase family 2 protein [Candidatus Riflebacteria bacterium]